jgi:DNA-binding response OmpR family regulator
MNPLALFVDDYEPHAEMLTLALETHRFTAISSTNGADAFDVFRSRPV